MTRHVRTLLAALAVAFAAATVAHAAGSTAMSVDMALADAGATDMAACQDCGNDAGSPEACDFDCVPLVLARPDTGGGLPVPDIRPATPDRGSGFAGRTGPPEPRPPRTLSLT